MIKITKNHLIKALSLISISILLQGTISVNAETRKKVEFNSSNLIEKFNNISEVNTLEQKTNEDISISEKLMKTKKTASLKSQAMVNNAVLSVEDSLTTQDNSDFYFFTVDSNRTMLMNITSSNSNYVAQLGIVDWQSGTFKPTNIYTFAGSQIKLNSLPVGSYGIRVFSNDNSLGNTYKLKMNALNPEGDNSKVLQKSDSLKYLVLQYANNDIYVNGKYVCNKDKSNSELNWSREFYFSHDGGYTSRSHNISDIKIKSVSGPVSYKSSYANSDNAMLIYLDQGTLFTYFESAFQSGVETAYESSFVDTTGKKTPRRIDADDFTNYGDHILVVDLNTGKPIDFFSVLNFYYGSGVEDIPTINFLN